MNQPLTVHMIGSAHIDPVWLWRWQAGVVEVLSTCKTAVELLERHPSFIFTRSDVWVHEIVERFDPELFKKIQRLAADGRWYPAGGWYIQPDCNLPIAESYQRHIDFGKEYFGEKFGIQVDVGFNVDSFGHNASLPDILARNGYDSYVMMRPGKGEKELPAELFRWKGNGGAEVTVWRIQASYNAGDVEALEKNIGLAVDAAQPGINDVMCFYGVGDHGGGPTEELITWIERNTEYGDGVKLEFSHPRRFFDSVKRSNRSLPVVHDELQMHAIGCYTVVADMKRAVRRAEHALLAAERSDDLSAGHAEKATTEIEDAWKLTLFNQFHDTLGGSSIREAYTDAFDQLGEACSVAERVTTDRCFDTFVALDPDPLQRVAALSFGACDYQGPILHEPWLHPNGFRNVFRGALLDETGKEIDYQIVQQSANLGPERAMLWEDTIKSATLRIYRLDLEKSAKPVESDIETCEHSIKNSYCTLTHGATGSTNLITTETKQTAFTDLPKALCALSVIDDQSDTWSHGIKGFTGKERGRFEVTSADIEESGPIRSTVRITACFGTSRATARFRLYRQNPVIDVDLEILWSEQSAVLKLIIPDTSDGDSRTDGVPIGSIERKQNGNEYPFLDWTLLESGLGIITPDCFGFDGSPGNVRLTLLRSPVYAWHIPTSLGEKDSYRYTDQGMHNISLRIIPGADTTRMVDASDRMHHKPRTYDWTHGMELP